MPERARYLTAHRMRFPAIWTPDPEQLAGRPAGALSWKIGPSGPVGPNGYRLPADLWGAVGLFPDLATAQAALASTRQFMPFLADAAESWHGLLQPYMHRGECNHLDRDHPGTLFDVDPAQPPGRCAVMTTAGFVLGPDLNIERVIDFRRNVDIANDWIAQADGCLANQTFTPHTVGDDGVTISLWRDDASMLAAAYRPGVHRALIDRHKAIAMMDRSSFTRCLILDSHGKMERPQPRASVIRLSSPRAPSYQQMRALALLTAALFAWNLIVHFNRPPGSLSRRCGNCLLGSLGLSAELALLGLLISLMILSKTRPRVSQIPDCLCALLGLFLTPYVIGVPIFALAVFDLAAPLVHSPSRLNTLPA